MQLQRHLGPKYKVLSYKIFSYFVNRNQDSIEHYKLFLVRIQAKGSFTYSIINILAFLPRPPLVIKHNHGPTPSFWWVDCLYYVITAQPAPLSSHQIFSN